MTTSHLPRLTARTPSTRHFAERAAHRGLRGEVLDFILTYGVEFRVAASSSFTVLERRLPASVRHAPIVSRARDWIVVTSDDGVLLTCYRRGDASRFLRTKPKRSDGREAAWGRAA